MTRDFKGDIDIYRVLSHPLKLATLHELQTVYSTEDLFDLLEYLDVHDELEYVHKVSQGTQ